MTTFRLAVNLKQNEDGPLIRLDVENWWAELTMQQAEWLLVAMSQEYQKALALSDKAGPPPMPKKQNHE